MALNPIAFTEQVVSDFLRYQHTPYPLARVGLHAQLKALLRPSSQAAQRARTNPGTSSPFTLEAPMMEQSLEAILEASLQGDSLRRSLVFVAYLREHGMHLERCQTGYWQDKLYWFVTLCAESVGYLLVNDPAGEEAPWTVWSDDSGSPCLIPSQEAGWR